MTSLSPLRHRLAAAIALLGLGLLALLGPQPSARGQGTDASENALRAALREGTHVFRRILFDSDFQPLSRFEQLDESPEETILIVLGDLNWLEKVPGGLQRFVERGGGALIASDRAIRNEAPRRELANVAGVTIAPNTLVYAGNDPRLRYQGREFCPVLVRPGVVSPDLLKNERPKQRPLHVATNVPSRLLVPGLRLPGQVRVLLALPPGCALDVPANRPPFGFQKPFQFALLFAVGGDVDKGRILVLADHSIFINQMMLPDDNNNVEFTYNCLNYLRDEGKRKRVLFVEDGKVHDKFEVPLKSLKVPPGKLLEFLWDNRNEITAKANPVLARAQRNNPQNEVVRDALADLGLRGERLGRFVALLLTAALVVYGIYRIGARARHSQDFAVPLLSQAVGSSLPAATLPEQRQQAQLRAGNLWSAAREVVRQWFAKVGVLPESPPRVVVDGNWWVAWRVRRLVDRLWAIAYGNAPMKVSPAAYRRLLVDLEDLRESIEDGWVRIRAQGPTSKAREPAA
jgi:hypothetical protein